jgi:hypothetical protein
MKQLPPRHSDPLLHFYRLLAVFGLVHRLRVPACSVVVPVMQDVDDPLASMVSVRISVATWANSYAHWVEALLVAQFADFLAGLHRVLLCGVALVSGAHRLNRPLSISG